MTSVWDHVKGISEKTSYTYNEETAKAFSSYTVNTNFSFFPDTIFLANEANLLGLEGQMHYDFLYYLLEPRKRYSKWFKKVETTKDLEIVMEYYDVNQDKAREFLKVLDSDQVAILSEKINKGGVKK